MENNKAVRTATIREAPESAFVPLSLTLDADNRYRWHQTADGADTEVSEATIESAIEAGEVAWRDWEFELMGDVTGDQILAAIDAGFAAGGVDEWDSPEFEDARNLTEQARCVWGFMGWRDTANCIRYHHMLGGVRL